MSTHPDGTAGPFGGLPARRGALVGRVADVQALVDRLETARLVTIAGPSGVGKTRVAVEVAGRAAPDFPDGACFVELGAVARPELVASTVARAVGGREEPAGAPAALLAGALAGRRLLFVLDGAEFLRSAVAEVVSSALRAAPGVRAVVTSRRPLGITGELLWRLAPLAVPPANAELAELERWESVRLFLARAREVDPRIASSTEDEGASVVRICRATDGVPLALELAAARVGDVSLPELARQLETSNEAGAGTIVDWGYDHLGRDEQQVLRFVACFARQFTLDAAEAVCGRADVVGPIARLVEGSLLVAERDGDSTVFRLLQPVRQFALTKLADAGEEAEARDRHLRYCLARVDNASARDQDDFRVALDWSLGGADREQALRLSIALSPGWELDGQWEEARRWLELALDGVADDSPARAAALSWSGHFATLQGDHRVAETRLAAAVDLAREVGPPSFLAECLRRWGALATRRTDMPAARARLVEALTLSRELDDKGGVVAVLNLLAEVTCLQADLGTSVSLCEEALAIGRQLTPPLCERSSLLNLARALIRSGRTGDAARALTAASEEAESPGDRHDEALCQLYAAEVAEAEGSDGAAGLFEAALATARALGASALVVDVSSSYGRTLLRLGQHDRAARLQHKALDAIEPSTVAGVECVEVLAGAMAASGSAADATRALAAAAAVREEIGCPLPPYPPHLDCDAVVQACSSALGPEFASAWDEGRRLTLPMAADLARGVASASATGSPSIGLPIPLTLFVGREEAIAAVGGLLDTAGLVTLTGIGGCGKTRLAIEVARRRLARHPDGVWLAELATASEPDGVLGAVAAAVRAPVAGQAVVASAVVEHLRSRRALLVLDGCEHSVGATRSLVRLLRAECPRLTIVVTGREALGLPDEVTWPVPNLPAGEAAELFRDRAALAGPTADRAIDDDAVAAVCERLAGLPLAIELAAARVDTLSVPEIARHLLDGAEHHPMAAVIDWTHDLLDEAERILFRRLAVFAGQFPVDAARAVCACGALRPEAVPAVLEGLVARSLVIGETSTTDTRYRLLDVIADYALQQLTQAEGEVGVEEARRRHCAWYAALSRVLSADGDDLRAALAWVTSRLGGRELSLRLALLLAPSWRASGRWTEARLWLGRTLSADGSAPVDLDVQVLDLAADFAARQGDADVARQLLEDALDRASVAGDRVLTAEVLHRAGTVAWITGDLRTARSHLAQSLDLARTHGADRLVTAVLVNLAVLDSWQGSHAQALGRSEEAVAGAVQCDDVELSVLAWGTLGYVRLRAGDVDGAAEANEQAVSLARTVSDELTALASAGLAEVAYVTRDHDRAVRLYALTIACLREQGDRDELPEALNGLGAALHERGELEAAAAVQREALAELGADGQPLFVAQCLESLAAVAAARGRGRRAGRLLGAAEAIRDAVGCPLPPTPVHVDYEATVAAACDAAGEDAFVRGWAEGRALPTGAAIKDAMDDRD